MIFCSDFVVIIRIVFILVLFTRSDFVINQIESLRDRYDNGGYSQRVQKSGQYRGHKRKKKGKERKKTRKDKKGKEKIKLNKKKERKEKKREKGKEKKRKRKINETDGKRID